MCSSDRYCVGALVQLYRNTGRHNRLSVGTKGFVRKVCSKQRYYVTFANGDHGHVKPRNLRAIESVPKMERVSRAEYERKVDERLQSLSSEKEAFRTAYRICLMNEFDKFEKQQAAA